MAKKVVQEVEDAVDAIGSDPRVYELGFHLDPELGSEEAKKAFQAIRASVAEKGSIVAEGEMQKIPLAYTISRQEVAGRRDFDSAYFAWIAYEATPENHAEVIALADENKNLVRFIDLLTTKEFARHALEMQEIALTMPEQPSEEAEVTAPSSELDAVLENLVV